MHVAAISIFKAQQRKFIRRLQYHGGKTLIIIDGTYSVRGSHSPDCFVRVKMKNHIGTLTFLSILHQIIKNANNWKIES